MMQFVDILALYVCPTFGCILAFGMMAAPCNAMRRALRNGSLGDLVPLPWAVGLGNCYGWSLFGYYQQDIFLMAANVPALFLCIWLNHGATKLQYHEKWQQQHLVSTDYQNAAEAEMTSTVASINQEMQSSSSSNENPISSNNNTENDNNLTATEDSEQYGVVAWVHDSSVPHERTLYCVILFWAVLSVYVGWFGQSKEASSLLLGWTVNLNLIFFYGAPLEVLRQVWQQKDSTPIHRPSLAASFCNATFWVIYGMALHNDFIIVPNAAGSLLGLMQIILCVSFPIPSNEESTASKSQALLKIAQRQAVLPEPPWGVMV